MFSMVASTHALRTSSDIARVLYLTYTENVGGGTNKLEEEQDHCKSQPSFNIIEDLKTQ